MTARRSHLAFVFLYFSLAPFALAGESLYQLSPSGNFVTMQDRQGDVWLLTANAVHKKLLFRANDDQTALQWSPDGRYLSTIHNHNLWLSRIHDRAGGVLRPAPETAFGSRGEPGEPAAAPGDL